MNDFEQRLAAALPPEVFYTHDFKTFTPVTDGQPEQRRGYAHELVTWTMPDGTVVVAPAIMAAQPVYVAGPGYYPGYYAPSYAPLGVGLALGLGIGYYSHGWGGHWGHWHR